MSGYAFVQLPVDEPMVRRVERSSARHDRRVAGTLSGEIQITFRCEQPVHIGAGFKTLAANHVVRRIVRSGDCLVVPGSTVKGAIRARFEAITRSCALEAPNERGKVISQTNRDVKRARLTDGARRLAVFDRSCGRGGMLCPACALFGYQSGDGTLRSRVATGDLLADAKVAAESASMPSQFGPRLHHLGEFKIDRSGREPEFVVGPLYGRKFYSGMALAGEAGRELVEVIPVGTKLQGRIRILNIEAGELGGLLVALGVSPASRLKIGGGKSHGFGRIVPVHAEFALIDHKRLSVDTVPEKWATAFARSGDHFAKGMERLGQIHGADC